MAISGFSLVYLGLGTIASLGTDLVMGAAPADKAGSASAMSEMVQELGVALGVALLGSLATFVYRTQISEFAPVGVATGSTSAVEEGLWATVTVAEGLPSCLLLEAQQAFTAGLNLAAAVSGIVMLTLAVVSIVLLRHIRALDETAPSDAIEGGNSCPLP